MRSRSTLARLQQFITLTLLLCATAWLLGHWRDSPLVAIGGFSAIIFGYAGFLAVEFFILGWVDTGDPTPKPAWSELARAWMHEVCAAPLVFCWRQPFRWNRIPDLLQPAAPLKGRRGAVFIHGFVCNRGFWTPWMRRMTTAGHAFAAVNLEPVFGSIDEYVSIVERAVQQVTEATGLAPVLVCHSMGGLAARAWLHARAGDARVHHVITIATPHRGTWLGRFSHLRNGRQMQLDSPWLAELARHSPKPGGAGFTCWYSNCDNIVFPVATATLPSADNRLLRGAAHVDLAFRPEVMQASLDLIMRDTPG